MGGEAQQLWSPSQFQSACGEDDWLVWDGRYSFRVDPAFLRLYFIWFYPTHFTPPPNHSNGHVTPVSIFFSLPPPNFDSLEEMLLRTHNSPPNQTLHRKSKGGILKLPLSSPTLSEHVHALSVIGKRGKVVGVGLFENNDVCSNWLV